MRVEVYETDNYESPGLFKKDGKIQTLATPRPLKDKDTHRFTFRIKDNDGRVLFSPCIRYKDQFTAFRAGNRWLKRLSRTGSFGRKYASKEKAKLNVAVEFPTGFVKQEEKDGTHTFNVSGG